MGEEGTPKGSTLKLLNNFLKVLLPNGAILIIIIIIIISISTNGLFVVGPTMPKVTILKAE
jgi:hypothetical protein